MCWTLDQLLAIVVLYTLFPPTISLPLQLLLSLKSEFDLKEFALRIQPKFAVQFPIN